jgi:peptidyl-prolyl cis-trans isomerase C
MSSPRCPTAGFAVLALLASLAGCDRSAVVEAGRTKVTRPEFEAYIGRRGGAGADDKAAALAELGRRALLAEAARRADLDEDPAVRARIAASRREILAQAFLERELSKADREDGLRKRYDEQKEALTKRRIHVAHVAFHARGGDAAARSAAQSRATRAYARLAGGEPFEKVAKELSEDSVTGQRGGDLGPLLEGQVDAAFFEAAAALRPGEFSPPIESPFGYHVLKALEPVERVVPTFEEVRGVLAAKARAESETKLLERLEEEIGVKLHPDRVAKAAEKKSQREGGKR